MRNAGLEEAQTGIKIAGRNINNLRYADDTTLMAESEVKWLSCVQLFATPWAVACTRLLRPWDFLGTSTGVGCHLKPLDESERGE